MCQHVESGRGILNHLFLYHPVIQAIKDHLFKLIKERMINCQGQLEKVVESKKELLEESEKY
jgi:hypothetical protein